MNDNYYTLLVWNSGTREWLPEFGDYDSDVIREQLDALSDELRYWEIPYRVIATADDQASIEAGIEKLNSLVEI